MDKDVNTLIQNALHGIRDTIDNSTIVGSPIKCSDVTIIPVSKVTVGFVAGGGDIKCKAKHVLPFAGASTSGFSLAPVGFICINGDDVKYVSTQNSSVDEQIIKAVNKVLDCVIKEVNNEE